MNKQIYILTKLYNINDRIMSLELCNFLDEQIHREALKGFNSCFLPYRDSNEKVKDLKDKTFEIFKMDCQSISNADVILGYVDGPTYDSGICFEIGYAYTKNVPIILLTSDYFKLLKNGKLYSISSLASTAAKIIHIRNNSRDDLSYSDSLKDIQSQLYNSLLSELNNKSIYERKTAVYPEGIKYDYLIDNRFNNSEIGRIALKKIIKILENKKLSYYICYDNDVNNINSIAEKVFQSKNVLLWGDDYEMNIDTCITQGLAYGLEKNIILYSSDKTSLFQDEEFILYKNPMIEHSATRIISSIEEFKYLV